VTKSGLSFTKNPRLSKKPSEKLGKPSTWTMKIDCFLSGLPSSKEVLIGPLPTFWCASQNR